MEYTVTGIITAICDESGVVSFAIDGTPKSFCFSKRIFYTFGMPCEGSMANILDEGMEVQLNFEARPDKKPRVTSVWLGNPPDAASLKNKVVSDTLLNAVYDRKGRVSGWIDDDNFLVESEDMQVLASKLTMYRDGDLVDHVVLDEEIRFDAIPLEESHPSGAFYEATCLWTGKAPSLVDRFSLNSDDDLLEEDLDCLESYELYGTVVVIPNDVIALVEVECNDVVFEVMLFRDSFDVDCDRIQDVVDVGDGIFLRMKSSFIFSHCRQWIAVRAWRAEFELHDDPEEVQTPVSSAMSTTITTVLIFQMMVGWMLSVAKIMFFLYNKSGVLSAATSDKRRVSLSINEPSTGREHSEVGSIQREFGFRSESGDVLFPEADSVQEDVELLEESAEEVLSKVCLDDSFCSESSEILFPEVECGEGEAGPNAKTAGVVLHEVGSHLDKNCMAEDSVERVSLGAESSQAVLSEVCSRQELNLGVNSSEEVVSEVISNHEDVSVSSEPCGSLSEACSEGVLSDIGSESYTSERNNIRETNFALNGVEVNSCPKKVLYSNPPLSGELWPLKNDCGLITYEGVNIFVERECFFVKGKKQSIKNFVTGRRNRFVNFEAILVDREKCGCRYVATCVWSETKPLVMVAANDLPAPNLALLQQKDKVFFGYVAKLCLPSFAMVIIPGEQTSVGVHVINFVDPLEEAPKKDALITDFVTLNDVVRFKIESGSKVLRAYEVQKTTLTKERWEETNAGVYATK